ncbi:MAG: tetratricopeptide repeat protein [Candidatus Puniceispirillaceae bacterium]
MATKRQITTYKNRFMKAVKEKDWDKVGDAIGWLTQLDETERDAAFQDLLDFLNKEIKSKDDEAILFFYRGNAKANLKKYDEAIADYDKAINLKPDNASAYNNRGIAKAELKKYDEAISDYDKAINLKPEDASAYNNRGIAHFQLDEIDKALKNIERAMEIAPSPQYIKMLTEMAHIQGWKNKSHHFGKGELELRRKDEVAQLSHVMACGASIAFIILLIITFILPFHCSDRCFSLWGQYPYGLFTLIGLFLYTPIAVLIFRIRQTHNLERITHEHEYPLARSSAELLKTEPISNLASTMPPLVL